MIFNRKRAARLLITLITTATLINPIEVQAWEVGDPVIDGWILHEENNTKFYDNSDYNSIPALHGAYHYVPDSDNTIYRWDDLYGRHSWTHSRMDDYRLYYTHTPPSLNKGAKVYLKTMEVAGKYIDLVQLPVNVTSKGYVDLPGHIPGVSIAHTGTPIYKMVQANYNVGVEIRTDLEKK